MRFFELDRLAPVRPSDLTGGLLGANNRLAVPPRTAPYRGLGGGVEADGPLFIPPGRGVGGRGVGPPCKGGCRGSHHPVFFSPKGAEERDTRFNYPKTL